MPPSNDFLYVCVPICQMDLPSLVIFPADYTGLNLLVLSLVGASNKVPLQNSPDTATGKARCVKISLKIYTRVLLLFPVYFRGTKVTTVHSSERQDIVNSATTACNSFHVRKQKHTSQN